LRILILFRDKWFHLSELKQMAQVLQPQPAQSSSIVQPWLVQGAPSGINDGDTVTLF
jgi:hypothetical protein